MMLHTTFLKHIFATLCALCCLGTAVSCMGEESAEPHFDVLYLNSYHRGYTWSDGIEQGLRDVFAASGKNITLYSEYLDTRRFPDKQHLPAMARALAEKYTDFSYDVLVVSDNNAFDFALRYREQLFPGVPVVFCGYNNFTPEVLQGVGNITGIAETLDFRATIDLALRLHPATQRLIFVVSDFSTSTARNLRRLEAMLPEYEGRYEIVLLKNLSMRELERRLAAAQPRSVGFIIGRAGDLREGGFFSVEQFARRLAEASRAPLYSMWDFHLNTGVMGGYILTGLAQGRTSAELVLSILAGTPADSLQVITRTPGVNRLDYHAMRRFHVREADLPPGSEIINKPLGLYETHREAAWAAGIVLVALLLMLAVSAEMVRRLRSQNRILQAQETVIRRHQAELEQRVEERTRHLTEARRSAKAYSEKLETLLSRINGISWELDLGSLEFTYVSPNAERILGYPVEAWVDMDAWAAMIAPEDRAFAAEYCQGETTAGRDHTFEYRIRKQNGDVVWVMDVISVVKDEVSGEPLKLTGFILDNSQRHQAKESLQQKESYQRALLDNFPFLVWLKDTESRFLAVNQPFAAAAGFTDASELAGKTDLDIWPRELAEAYRADDREVMASLRQKEVEEEVADQGVLKWFETYKTPVLDSNGELLGTVGFARDISERKHAEAALMESEARFRKLIQATPTPLGYVTADGRIEYFNTRFSELFGYTAEDIPTIEDWWQRAYPEPEYRARVLETWNRAVAEAMAENHDIRPQTYRVTCKNGAVRIMEISGAALGDGVLASFVDLTEHKRAEAALRESEQRLRIAGQAAYDLIYEWDVESDALEWFGDVDEMLGFEEGALSRDIAAWLALIHPADAGQLADAVERHKTSADPIQYQYRIRHRDGSYRYWDDYALPMLDEQQRPYKWIGVCTDVTGRRRAETLYRTLFEQSPDAIVMLDPETRRFIVFNDRLCELLGYDREQTAELTIADYDAEESPEQTEQRIQTAIEQGAAEFETRFRTKQGVLKDVMVFIRVIEFFGKTVFHNVFRDVTEHNRAQRALKESQRDLQTIFGSVHAMIWHLDSEHRIRKLNHLAAQHSGLALEQALGKTALELFPPEFAEAYHADNLEVMASGRPKIGIIESGPYPDGGTGWFQTDKVPYFDDEGQVSGITMFVTDITQVKRAEAALRDSEKLYQSLVNSLPMSVYRIDREGRITFVNQALALILGVSAAEMSGKAVYDFYPPELAQKYRHTDAQVVASGEILHLIEEHVHPQTGERIHVEVLKIPVVGSDGEVEGVQGVFWDITERRKAEQERDELLRSLEESEARFRRFFEKNSSVMLLIKPETGKIVSINEAAASYYGYSLEQLLGMSIRDINTLPEAEIAKERQRALREERNYFNFRHRLRNGEIRDVEVYSTPIQMSEQVLLFSIIHDITQRRKAERALRASEQKYRSLLETTQEGFWLIDTERKTLEVNDSLCAMLGYAREEMLGKTPFDFVPAEQHATLSAQLANLPRAEYRNYELTFQKKDGGSLHTLITASMLRNETGKVLGRFAFITDISELKRYQAELVRAREAAEAANRAKSSFLANMSHELRTPLNAVMGYAQMLAKAPDLLPEYRRMAETINRSGEHLLTLLNDILDLSKIEAGRFDLHPKPCDMRYFLRAIGEIFQARSAQKGLDFQQEIAENVPSEVEMDEIRSRQILLNLLSNAVKFTERGYVRLCCNYTGGTLYFSVHDSGPGIAPEQQESIFQPFQQAGDERYKAQGTGLGLAICRKLTELMGGSLEVESRAGQGCTFYLRIPAEVLSREVLEPVTSRLDTDTVQGYARLDDNAPLRTLIVDDIAENREILFNLLRPLGFSVRHAASGEECLRVLQDWRPDVVLMDLKMPGLDGLETTRRIRDMDLEMPIIAVSASAFSEDRSAATAAGCNDHLAKPVHASELFACLSKHLQLEWNFAPTAAPPATALPAAYREKLLYLLKKGDVGALSNYLEDLRAHPELAEEIAALLELAQGFKLKELSRRLRI